MNSAGFLLINKPQGITSHDVVAKVRKALGTKKVGHAGTLDPMATGLLVLGFNQGTKLLTFAVGLDKTYEATILLGSQTTTDDREGEVISKADKAKLEVISEEAILAGIKKLTGLIKQVPSSVSAIKVDGVRAYDRVRNGEEVELKAREVTVSRFDVVEIRRTDAGIELDVVVDCSSGTYIRALARDLGNDLEVGGHLVRLNRSRVGSFDLKKANEMANLADGNLKAIALIDACSILMPNVEIQPDHALAIRQGKLITGSLNKVSGLTCENELVAIAENKSENQIKSLVVF